MTGPEAIAAAERLLKQITIEDWTFDRRNVVRNDGVGITCAEADFIAAAPELVATLRAALLQSQEALKRCCEREVLLSLPSQRVIVSAALKQVQKAFSETLLSPPVAPKER